MAVAGLMLAAVLAVIAVAALALQTRAFAVVPRLGTVEPLPVGPRVSVIVAARDEERHIRTAVAALLAQDYRDVELIVVEDRSTDRTGAILDSMAAKTSRLVVEHVKELPAGWLGKNHALHRGAKRATGDILLFIDGDVVLDRTAIARAIRPIAEDQADHVTVTPLMELPTWPLKAVVAYFLTWGVVVSRSWAVANPRSSAYIGIGAFNMVRATSLAAVGGFTRIRMRPDDDLMLGKLLKAAGARTKLYFAMDLVSVEWYRSIADATRGFRKNSYTVLQYNPIFFAAAVVGTLAQGFLPFIAVWFTNGVTQGLFGVTIAALMAAFARTCIEARLPLWLTLTYPLATLLECGMVVTAVTRTIVAGGIDWRGTFYPLEELKSNRV